MLRKTPVALALGMAWGMIPFVASAQNQTEPAEAAIRMGEITVTATRTERQVDNVPATVTIIPQRRIEQEGARDLKDLFRNEIDMDVRMQPTRFTAAGAANGRAGSEGINIRGLEGNQVLMMVDGIRLPNAFSFASFSTGRGDFLEVDGIKSVEVLRGPSSTQYGSDGLGGAVSFLTLAPADLLKDGQAVGGFNRTAYMSVDRSWSNTLGLAARGERWQGMLLGTYRQGHEVENKGGNDAQNVDRTTPNPVDYDNRYLLGKAIFSVDARNRVGLTLESQRRQQDTTVYSALAKPPLASTSAVGLVTDDHLQRDRVSLEHRYDDVDAPWVQRAISQVYWQNARINQLSLEDRYTAADRTRDNTYTTRVFGLSTLLESNFSTGMLQQRLTYGIDASRSDISGVRDGSVPPFGETFPTRPFPDTAYTLAGAFIQDEIEAGAFSLIPGLRYDFYQLDPDSASFTGAATRLSDHAVTPRLGGVWRLHPAFAPYANWAMGFRAPAPDQVNNGFTNLASGYMSVGNPNLKPEQANSMELGFRGQVETLRYSLAAYHNRYKDFISQQVVGGAGTPADPTVFQYINLAEARISGIELRGEWQIDRRWRANGGLALARGDSKTDGVSTPLDTVAPLRVVLGLNYDAGAWGARAHLIHNQAKDADRIAPPTPPSTTPQFAPPSSTVLNLGAYWKVARNLTLNANLNNVFDAKYWNWADVRGLADNSPVKDAYTAPGRNVQASLRYDF